MLLLFATASKLIIIPLGYSVLGKRIKALVYDRLFTIIHPTGGVDTRDRFSRYHCCKRIKALVKEELLKQFLDGKVLPSLINHSPVIKLILLA